MRAWIYTHDLEKYMQLMRQSGADPSVVQQEGDKTLVEMTAQVASEWTIMGLWYELG